MFLRCCVAVATFALCSATAQAETFDLNLNFLGPLPFEIGSEDVTGTIIIDTTTGTVTATDLTLSLYSPFLEESPPHLIAAEKLGGAGFNMVAGPVTYTEPYPPNTVNTYYQLVISDPTSANELVLEFPNASLVGYNGGGFCTFLVKCPTYFERVYSYLNWSFAGQSGTSYYYDGDFPFSLEPASVPEPSTLTLIGTGLIGFAGAFRHQRLARLARKKA